MNNAHTIPLSGDALAARLAEIGVGADHIQCLWLQAGLLADHRLYCVRRTTINGRTITQESFLAPKGESLPPAQFLDSLIEPYQFND